MIFLLYKALRLGSIVMMTQRPSSLGWCRWCLFFAVPFLGKGDAFGYDCPNARLALEDEGPIFYLFYVVFLFCELSGASWCFRNVILVVSLSLSVTFCLASVGVCLFVCLNTLILSLYSTFFPLGKGNMCRTVFLIPPWMPLFSSWFDRIYQEILGACI